MNSTDEAMKLKMSMQNQAMKRLLRNQKKFFKLYSDLARQTFQGLIATMPTAKLDTLSIRRTRSTGTTLPS